MKISRCPECRRPRPTPDRTDRLVGSHLCGHSGFETKPKERTMTGDFEQRRVALSTGVALDVVDMGPKDAPPLIFLHGLPASHPPWPHPLPPFSDHSRFTPPAHTAHRRPSSPPAPPPF